MAKRLYVGNLNYQTTSDSLFQVFSECGDITEVTVIAGKGFGFIEFSETHAACHAIQTYDGVELDGREIRVEVANPRPERGDGDYCAATIALGRLLIDTIHSLGYPVGCPVEHRGRPRCLYHRGDTCLLALAGVSSAKESPMWTTQPLANRAIEMPAVEVSSERTAQIALNTGISSYDSASRGVSLR